MLRNLLITAVMVAALAAATGIAQAAFEDVEVSPRSRAMGTAYIGLKFDAYAPWHNPATLAWAEDVRGAASYVRPFGYEYSSQSVISAAGSIGKWGGVGVGIRRFGVEYRGEDLTSETTVSLSHGITLLDDQQSKVSVGWSLNVYSLDYGISVTGIDPGSATALGLNVAAQAEIYDRTRVGFYSHNINNTSIGSLDEEQLPRRVGAGVAYNPYHGVTTVLDISTELGEQVQFRGGTEFQVTNFLWLRAGLRTEPNIFTAGVGIEHSGLTLDYGFSSGGGVLSETHQFGVSYAFPGGE